MNQVDVCFVVDTTGSMGSFIEVARNRLVEILQRLAAHGRLDMRFGLVEYRDHPPQDNTFVTRLHPFTDSAERMQKEIKSLKVGGGGDTPEAVFSGLRDACTGMEWRPHSARYALLVGDAPPHGVGASGDGFAKGDPSGLDVKQCCALAEEARITLHALLMGHDKVALQAFSSLAGGTGGTCQQVNSAAEVVEHIERMLKADFADLELDAQVLALVRAHGLDPEDLARRGSWSRPQVARALARLGQRGLFD